MISDKFRRQLRQEAKLWQAEEMITSDFYQQLSERYQFQNLETASRDRFLMVLISVGAILLGLGVITFIAANWQTWSKTVKFILLLCVFISVNTGAFYLWRGAAIQPYPTRRKRLGEGLLILGSLILGANLALTAQIFHIGGDSYGLFLVWGLGVLTMAYSLRLTSLGMIAILLIILGYWQGIGVINYSREFSPLKFLIEHTALFAGLFFVPLAYWCRSRGIFILAMFALLPSLQWNLMELFRVHLPWGIYMAIACTFPAALLWGYDDIIWPKIDSRVFQPIARTLALWYLSIFFFIASFHWFWDSVSPSSFYHVDTNNWLRAIDVIIYGLLILWQWFNLAKPSRLNPNKWGFDNITTVIAGFIIVTAIVSILHLSPYSIPGLATFIINVEMFLLAIGLIRIGLSRGNRHAFWGGLVLLTLDIISRMFEYDTELLLKAFVLILCGVGVILAGLWFERHLSTLSPSQED